MKKKRELTLAPQDYIVFAGGLKIENVGESVISFIPPQKYTTKPFVVTSSSDKIEGK